MKYSKCYIEKLISSEGSLSTIADSIIQSLEMLIDCINSGNKLLICGNGGSAADAEHIVGELMKGFILTRKIKEKQFNSIINLFPELQDEIYNNLQQAIPAVSLVNNVSFTTAFINDVGADYVFAQQVMGLGREGDVLWGISTSGNSINVVRAFQIAKAFNIKTLAFTGGSGGGLAKLSDTEIRVPYSETYKIQEIHIKIYHALCADLEHNLFG